MRPLAPPGSFCIESRYVAAPGLATMDPATASESPGGTYTTQLTVSDDPEAETVVDNVYFDAVDDTVYNGLPQ